MSTPGMVVVAEESAGGAYADPVHVADGFAEYAASFLVRGTRRFCNVDVIAADVLPADIPERTMFCDPAEIQLVFPGASPDTAYELEASFLSDGHDRVVEVRAGDRPLGAPFALPRGKVVFHRWTVPVVTGGSGQLEISVARVQGADAVVSALTVRAPQGTPALSRLRKRLSLPRLSPVPAAAAGLDEPILDLDGQWLFNPAPPQGFASGAPGEGVPGWHPIEVPGQWVQQGFTVAANAAAGYLKSFIVPEAWRGRRMKLRFDAVYCDATVWVSGRELGRHIGGFTPFEIDISDAVEPGQPTTLALAVASGGDGDRLASGSAYAAHDLGGISRKVRLVALPVVHVAALHLDTRLLPGEGAAALAVEVIVVNEGAAASSRAEVRFSARDSLGHPVVLARDKLAVPVLAAGQSCTLSLEESVRAPVLWDVDHPHLYTLRVELAAETGSETVVTRFGVRGVRVEGNRVLLNGNPLLLKGVCRHEVHPTRGRSLTASEWAGDVETLARGNVNFIRTSHYPPAEELLDACDSVGMLVELEAPLCWSPPDCPEHLVASQVLEMLESSRNHPSVVIWSIANESRWDGRFDLAARLVHALDPSRPRIFSHGGIDIVSVHYPGFDAPALTDESQKPVLFDEFCHLNAYNRRELAADPGLRDAWGLGLAAMWETLRAHPGCLGGALWAGIDDTFFLPGGRTVGYGTWGPLDGWRREKPEYWHMARAFAPVRIVEDSAPLADPGEPVRLTVENRSDGADLAEMRFAWSTDRESGSASTAGAPGERATLLIPLSARPAPGTRLHIRVAGPRGFVVERCSVCLGTAPRRSPGTGNAARLSLAERRGSIILTVGERAFVFDRTTGMLREGRTPGGAFALSGPFLTIVPLDAEGGGIQLAGAEPVLKPLWGLLDGWKAGRVQSRSRSEIGLNARGTCNGARGAWRWTLENDGTIVLAWSFTVADAVNPRQTGVTLSLPRSFDTLSWKRKGQWSWYPESHIGRTEGRAAAFPGHPVCGLAGPREKPSWPWCEDVSAYGSNDFRSTKMNIFSARLTDGAGTGIEVLADGDRHAHAWIDTGAARLTVAGYVNEGAESYHRMTRAVADRPLPAGGTIEGRIRVRLTGAFP